MRRRDTFFPALLLENGALGNATSSRYLETSHHHCGTQMCQNQNILSKKFKNRSETSCIHDFLSFFLSYLQMECRAMKYFPAHISWTTGRKRMLSNEARKYTKISFQICCRTKRFWDRDHVFLWLVYISKEFSMQKAFFPTRCYCCASNAFLPYITVFLTKYMQGSKHAVISLLSKIRSEEGDF